MLRPASLRYFVILALLLIVGFSLRFVCWIFPGIGASKLSSFDVYFYTAVGINYVDAILEANLTKITSLNPGVPPLGMILTGLGSRLFASYLHPIHAAFLLSIVASTLTALPIYLIVREYSHNHALLSAAIYLLDPFTIQFSVSFLDVFGTLFASFSAAYLIRNGWCLKATLFAALAVMSKLSFLVFLIVIAFLLYHSNRLRLRQATAYVLISASSLSLSPWLWTMSSASAGISGNIRFGNIPFSIIVSPFLIDVPASVPWHILSYLGMGVVAINTLPFITPLALLVLMIWRSLHGNRLSSDALIPAAAAVATVAFIPRAYWTYNWGGGALQGVLTRQFYPYYFYVVAPFFAMNLGISFAKKTNAASAPRWIFYPICMSALLSPLAIVMNLGFPYWDFIFTLIYSASIGAWVVEGIIAVLLTIAITEGSAAMSEILYRRATTRQQ